MNARRRGFALPLVMSALVLVALLASATAWTARAQRAAEHSAASADQRVAVADSVLGEQHCDAGVLGTQRRVETVTPAGRAVVLTRYARGACWVQVAVGDTTPIMGTLLEVPTASVTPLANASHLGLPSIEASPEFPVSHSASLPNVTRGRHVPGPSWLDLR